jgi:hypothetical protein
VVGMGLLRFSRGRETIQSTSVEEMLLLVLSECRDEHYVLVPGRAGRLSGSCELRCVRQEALDTADKMSTA